MAENSKIEWTDHTFNAWVGCTKVSPACDHCYAEGWAKRTGQGGLWQGERRRTSAVNWRKPLKWDAEAAAAGKRAKVFCCSLADVFDNQADPVWRLELWLLIAKTPNLDWLLLTKRPQNIRKMLPLDWHDGYPNVWLGTTVENQAEADRRIPHLLGVSARIRFLSCEPLLGPIDLIRVNNGFLDSLRGMAGRDPSVGRCNRINWVIVGGESGHGARDMQEEWALDLLRQCEETGTAYFFKQMARKAPIPPHMLVSQFPVSLAA